MNEKPPNQRRIAGRNEAVYCHCLDHGDHSGCQRMGWCDMMRPSERLHKLAEPIGHEWTPLAGLRVCIHCGCDHDTPDALERCIIEEPHNAVADYHLHELKSAIDRCMADGVCEYEIVSAVAEAMAGKGKK